MGSVLGGSAARRRMINYNGHYQCKGGLHHWANNSNTIMFSLISSQNNKLHSDYHWHWFQNAMISHEDKRFLFRQNNGVEDVFDDGSYQSVHSNPI